MFVARDVPFGERWILSAFESFPCRRDLHRAWGGKQDRDSPV